MVKPLSFKGDKKVKKRKHKETDTPVDGDDSLNTDPNSTGADLEETWTTADRPSDLSGPIMILLPEATGQDDNQSSSKPTCLASDATGAVFASPVENIIPETPARLSAEPSDVRQVWVVTKIPGEDSGWTLKSHQGRYLSADRFGVLRCEREAAGIEEVFRFVETGKVDSEVKGEDERRTIEGGFHICNSRKTYVSAELATSRNSRQMDIRADATTPSLNSVMFIRMQSRFKPQLKANRERKEKEKISRKQLEEAVGRRLDEDEVKRLKKAKREGEWHEAVLDARVKGKHDKFG